MSTGDPPFEVVTGEIVTPDELALLERREIAIEMQGVNFRAGSWQALASLHGKVAKVLGNLSALERDGTNNYSHYDYVSYEAASAALRKLLAEAGLAFYVSVADLDQEPNKEKGFHTLLYLRVVLGDSDSGAIAVFNALGEASDSSDKSVNQALTGGLKYWLLRSMLTSTQKDAGDPDAKNPTTKPPTKPPAKRTPRKVQDGLGWIREANAQLRFEEWLRDDNGIDPKEFYAYQNIKGFAEIRTSKHAQIELAGEFKKAKKGEAE